MKFTSSRSPYRHFVVRGRSRYNIYVIYSNYEYKVFGKEIFALWNKTFWDFAENDYHYFIATYEAGMVANIMGAMAQEICEKYMKHIISEFQENSSLQEEQILKTRSLCKLIGYIEKEMEIPLDDKTKKSMKLIDGYYFSTRYPGEDSIELEKDDIEDCAVAVARCRNSVIEILSELENDEHQMEAEEEYEL